MKSSQAKMRAEVAELREEMQKQDKKVVTSVETLRTDLISLEDSVKAVARLYDFLTESESPRTEAEPVIASLADSEWKEVAKTKKTESPNKMDARRVPQLKRMEPAMQRTPNAKTKLRREVGTYVSRLRMQDDQTSHDYDDMDQDDDDL